VSFSENVPFGTNSENPAFKAKLATLTEGRFRYHWERTDKIN
jgi:hypothetical protein